MKTLSPAAICAVLLAGSTAGPIFSSAGSPAPSEAWMAKVDPWILSMRHSGEREFLVFLKAQSDLSRSVSLRSKEEKGEHVYRQLTTTAERTQGPILAALRAEGVEHRSYWVANMIWVRSTLDTVRMMAERKDVQHLYANPEVRLAEPFKNGNGHTSGTRAVEWNIAHVNADDVWAAGVTGDGVVVAGQDSGYRWDHPALVDQYRGGPAGSHDYNWHDAIHSGGGSCGADSTEPCDDHGHGTHTMGTIVGDDGAGNQVGMAPTAQWIGCRNMNQGTGTPATYAECYQFFIAPTDLNGQNPDPSRAPHVINNSWGCPPSEGCTDPNVLLTVVQNVRAAGIVTVHSAGNDGSSCSTVADPAAIYEESFSVGATNSSDSIASFSSRGPVAIDGSNRLKPNISAPGVNIRSSTRDGSYQGGWDGTSMAGPHVAGLVALLISRAPGLAGNVDLIEDIIESTAVGLTSSQGCGGDGPGDIPNNVYGWGRIDALAAHNYPLDFALTATPETVAICAPADAVYQVTLEPFLGFDEDVTLSTESLPISASAAFSPNPVTPPATSTLTVSGIASLAPGDHGFEIVGTSSPGAIERRSPATLTVFDLLPTAPGLTAPADDSLDVPLQPTLTWTAVAQAATYLVEVAADPAFSNVLYTQTSTGNQHMLGTGLEPESEYWWRVQASNPCGSGPWSSIYSFTTRTIPPVLLVDDDDNSPDVRATYTAALDALGLAYDVWDTNNSDNEPNSIQLGPYSTVIWFTGDEFGGAAGPGSAGESALSDWQAYPSRCLLVSAQDYFYDRGLTAFMSSALGVASVDNDVNQSTVTGSGSIFGGLGPYALSYPFSNYSDEFLPGPGAETAFTGNQGPAAVTRQTINSLTSFWGFPLEAIPSPSDREATLSAFFTACSQLAVPIFTDGFETGNMSRWSDPTPE